MLSFPDKFAAEINVKLIEAGSVCKLRSWIALVGVICVSLVVLLPVVEEKITPDSGYELPLQAGTDNVIDAEDAQDSHALVSIWPLVPFGFFSAVVESVYAGLQPQVCVKVFIPPPETHRYR